MKKKSQTKWFRMQFKRNNWLILNKHNSYANRKTYETVAKLSQSARISGKSKTKLSPKPSLAKVRNFYPRVLTILSPYLRIRKVRHFLINETFPILLHFPPYFPFLFNVVYEKRKKICARSQFELGYGNWIQHSVWCPIKLASKWNMGHFRSVLVLLRYSSTLRVCVYIYMRDWSLFAEPSHQTHGRGDIERKCKP